MSETVQPVSTDVGVETEQALRLAVHGEVLVPGDVGYGDARTVYNGMIDRRPPLLVRVTGAPDVVAALAFARDRSLQVSVRGGGHGVAGHALGGDLVIDLSALRGVTIDAQARTAVVQGGATWSDVDNATQAHGLAVPGGRVSHTGVAGLTLGGGEGWLSGKHGLTSDNLIAAELVTADGRVVTASAASEPELFWALRGGGGNFGVVLSFTFQLHEVGPLVLGGVLGYRVSDAHAVLAALTSVYESGDTDFAGAAVFMSAPPAPFVPGHLVGEPILAIIPAYFGDLERAAAVIAPLRELVTPLFDAAGPMPYVVLQSMIDEGSQFGWRNRWGADFVPELSPRLISVLQDAIVDRPSPLSQIVIARLGAKVRSRPEDFSAFPGRTGGAWLVHPLGTWTDAADDAANETWTRDLVAAIRAFDATGSYLNLEDPDDDRVRWAMGADRYARLQQVKADWDPWDVFRHCAHIRLPAS